MGFWEGHNPPEAWAEGVRGDQLRMRATPSGWSVRAEVQMSPFLFHHAWPCLPHLNLVTYSAQIAWPLLQRGHNVRCVAIFWGHGHHARRPELGKRVTGARMVQGPGFLY